MNRWGVTAQFQADLLVISRLCHQGRCDRDTASDAADPSCAVGSSFKAKADAAVSSVGIGALFVDLQRMVAQSKTCNANNPHFLPWCLADMMDKALYRLKVVLAEAHGIPSLVQSLKLDAVEL